MAVTLSPSGLQYVQGTDVESAFPAIDQSNKTILNNATFFNSGTLASRPAASSSTNLGSLYYATDTAQLFLNETGSAWTIVSVASLTYTGLTLASGITTSTQETTTPSARIEGDRVVLRGSVDNSSGFDLVVSSTIFTLPSGMRPPTTLLIGATAGNPTANYHPLQLGLHTTGIVTIGAVVNNADTIALNGLNFGLT